MLVLNLRVSSHRTLDDVNGTSSSNSVYGSSRKSPKKSTADESEEILAAPTKTILTEEDKKYLAIYENEHDKYFGSAKHPKDKTEIRIYVSSTKEKEESKAKSLLKSLFKAQTNAPEDEVTDKDASTVITIPESKSSVEELVPAIEEVIETPEVIEEKQTNEIENIVGAIEQAVDNVPTKERKNWFKRLFAAIKEFIQRLFRKKKKEAKDECTEDPST